MSTPVKEILDYMIVRIPTEFKTELSDDYALAQQGIIEMGIAMGNDFTFSGENASMIVNEDLTMSNKWLASRFAYRCYLERLWDELNRNSVNFSTLTFSIKSLEKRPESVQEELYKLNRYLDSEISRASGASAIVGFVSEFGSSIE